MATVYTRQQTKWGGTFSSDTAAFTIAGTATPLGIVQNVQMQYAQQIARIYDVSNGGFSGSGIVPVFYVGGRTQGQATIARVLGPQSGALCDFYTVMGNVCSPQDLNFTFAGGCQGAAGGGTSPTQRSAITNATGNLDYNKTIYSVQGAVMTNVGVTVGSQDMIVNENVTLMFANLECTKA
jgi:hypothetical protein